LPTASPFLSFFPFLWGRGSTGITCFFPFFSLGAFPGGSAPVIPSSPSLFFPLSENGSHSFPPFLISSGFPGSSPPSFFLPLPETVSSFLPPFFPFFPSFLVTIQSELHLVSSFLPSPERVQVRKDIDQVRVSFLPLFSPFFFSSPCPLE